MSGTTAQMFVGIFVLAVLNGCASLNNINKSLQPSSLEHASDGSLPWGNFDEAARAFNAIKPGESTFEDIKKVGFDPKKVPQTEYVIDVRTELLPNKNDSVDSLPPGAQACYRKMTLCKGYKFTGGRTEVKGVGNTFLRMVKMKSRIETNGWKFNAHVYLLPRKEIDPTVVHGDPGKKEELVTVFGLFGGVPNINSVKTTTTPLGPVEIIFSIGGSFTGVRIPSINLN